MTGRLSFIDTITETLPEKTTPFNNHFCETCRSIKVRFLFSPLNSVFRMESYGTFILIIRAQLCHPLANQYHNAFEEKF